MFVLGPKSNKALIKPKTGKRGKSFHICWNFEKKFNCENWNLLITNTYRAHVCRHRFYLVLVWCQSLLLVGNWKFYLIQLQNNNKRISSLNNFSNFCSQNNFCNIFKFKRSQNKYSTYTNLMTILNWYLKLLLHNFKFLENFTIVL